MLKIRQNVKNVEHGFLPLSEMSAWKFFYSQIFAILPYRVTIMQTISFTLCELPIIKSWQEDPSGNSHP